MNTGPAKQPVNARHRARATTDSARRPTVSVIIPTYNRADYIVETVECVLAQHYPIHEIIVIDDGSEDDTLVVLDDYRERIRVISRPNKGENETVNEGFAIATGDFVCVVNSDDPIAPDCISTLIAAIRSVPDAICAYGDWARIGPHHEFFCRERLKAYTIENMYESLNIGIGPGTLIRRHTAQRLGGRATRYRFAGDMELFLRLALCGPFVHVPTVLATHRDHPDSASVQAKTLPLVLEVYDAFSRTLDDPAAPSTLRQRSAWHRKRILRTLAKRYELSHFERLQLIARANAQQVALMKARVRRAGSTGFVALLMAKAFRRILFPLFDRGVLRLTRRHRDVDASPRPATSRFCFSTRFLPPMWSGQAVVIARLLHDVDPKDYRLIGHPVLPDRTGDNEFVGGLPAKYYDLPPVRQLPVLPVAGFWARTVVGRWMLGLQMRMLKTYNLWIGIRQRAAQIVDCLAEDRPEILIGCTGDKLDLPATWLAATVLGSKSAVYYFDDYGEQWWAEPESLPILRFIQDYIVPRTNLRLAPNEAMRDKLVGRYGGDCRVVRNPMPSCQLPVAVKRFPARGRTVRLIFTGAVYHLNYAVFRSLREATEQIDQYPVELHIYSAQPRQQMEQEGLIGRTVHLHSHAPPDEIVDVQRHADILLIPFNISPASDELVRVSATAKLADFLATGRPILAICPQGSFLSGFLSTHDCGLDINSTSPVDIARAIRTIVERDDLRARWRTNARTIAEDLFDPVAARRELLSAIDEAIRGAGNVP